MKIASSRILTHTGYGNNYIPIALRREVIKRDKGRCVFCGKETKFLCYSIPRCRGGQTTVKNLLACCQKCRRRKQEGTSEEFVRELELEKEIFKNQQNSKVEIGFPAKVCFLDNEVIEGVIFTPPGEKDNGCYLYPEGKIKAVYINLAAIKKIIFQGYKNTQEAIPSSLCLSEQVPQQKGSLR